MAQPTVAAITACTPEKSIKINGVRYPCTLLREEHQAIKKGK